MSPEAAGPVISVVTATYERAATLPRLFASLEQQAGVDFEWVVVDDGSSDGTAEVIAEMRERADFPVVYVRQENGGKHHAINTGVRNASGEFCAVMDDDDWYTPGALGRMLACWDEIPEPYREQFANIEGLCADPAGEVIGDRFPTDVCDSNGIEISLVHRVDGDKVGMYRRDVIAAYPFPEDLGWHVTAALAWNRIAARWWTRYVNEVWAHKEYLGEGLTSRETEVRLLWPESMLVFWSELAAVPRPMPLAFRFKASANAIRYGFDCGEGLRKSVALAPTRGWAAVALPAGVALHLRDRRQRAKLEAES